MPRNCKSRYLRFTFLLFFPAEKLADYAAFTKWSVLVFPDPNSQKKSNKASAAFVFSKAR